MSSNRTLGAAALLSERYSAELCSVCTRMPTGSSGGTCQGVRARMCLPSFRPDCQRARRRSSLNRS